MIVTPAVDLRSGKCVQLVGGSYDAQAIEIDDPVEVALNWEAAGFRTLHVVDLDAATGRGENVGVIERILSAVKSEVQVGGGIRSTEQVEMMLASGARRVVVGTRAVQDSDWLSEIASSYPDRIVVAADIRDRAIVTHGWTGDVEEKLELAIARLTGMPIAALLVTAVHKEGLMEGPDLQLMQDVVRESKVPVQASGGIGSMTDLRSLAGIGVASTIVGMALYTGKLDAIELAGEFKE
jgi:phosphoribosylformimino-5-aminoimidazole carboxamide ribotide isomerase